ncbi:hypothetical protein DCAR_0414739 [Daucus carota subsp. sativus]|uniref:Uncharacterized protein n=1 Tax=Daucus carota subsp. sativus TaxID=79200 RepID=A0A164ZZR7_DAUCS|nr:hypothetical protein DCAR_0414739 [Daucus carota subsp. sativus]
MILRYGGFDFLTGQLNILPVQMIGSRENSNLMRLGLGCSICARVSGHTVLFQISAGIADRHRFTESSTAVDLVKKLRDEFQNYDMASEDLFDESLDFLLTTWAKANGLQSCYSMWQEYETVGLPCNVPSLLKMYQALLALGDHKSARKLLRKILIFDPHVCCVIDSSQRQPMYAGQPTLRIKILQTQTRHAETKISELKLPAREKSWYIQSRLSRAIYKLRSRAGQGSLGP